jgi:hypothetical protein
MIARADDLSEGTDLPQPGTNEEEEDVDRREPTEGPGNVSVDEPTEPALDPDTPDQRAIVAL